MFFFFLWLGGERHELVDAGLERGGLLDRAALVQAVLAGDQLA